MYASQWRANRICRFAMSYAPAWWLGTSAVHDAAPGSQFTSACPVSPSMLVRAAASSGAKIFPAYLTTTLTTSRTACHRHTPASACTQKGIRSLRLTVFEHPLARLARDRWHVLSSPWRQRQFLSLPYPSASLAHPDTLCPRPSIASAREKRMSSPASVLSTRTPHSAVTPPASVPPAMIGSTTCGQGKVGLQHSDSLRNCGVFSQSVTGFPDRPCGAPAAKRP